VDGSPPPIIQRQELPEEEEEELQLKREPAAVQRQDLPEEEEEELMMKPEEGQVGPQGGQVPPDVEAAIHRARGGGQPLDGALQEQMSASLGHDFSGVRVHTDTEADELNQQLQAKAFTTGADIFFKRGAYGPASSAGRELIAHELSHMVQQSTGRVPSSGGGITVRPAGDAFEQEADALAGHVIRTGSTSQTLAKQVEAHYQLTSHSAEATVIRDGQRHDAGRGGAAKVGRGARPLSEHYGSGTLAGQDAENAMYERRKARRPLVGGMIAGHIDPVTYQRSSIGIPVVITVHHNNPNADAIRVTRRTRALHTKYDIFPPHKKQYCVTNGVGVNTGDWYYEYKTINDAKWQDDGPGLHNVHRGDNRVVVNDSPGFSWVFPKMPPVSLQAEFEFRAEDPADRHVMTVKYETEFTEKDSLRALPSSIERSPGWREQLASAWW
jgi:hypothetical protein